MLYVRIGERAAESHGMEVGVENIDVAGAEIGRIEERSVGRVRLQREAFVNGAGGSTARRVIHDDHGGKRIGDAGSGGGVDVPCLDGAVLGREDKERWTEVAPGRVGDRESPAAKKEVGDDTGRSSIGRARWRRDGDGRQPWEGKSLTEV